MSDFEQIWNRLIRLARRAPDDDVDVSVPVGFSTRVVACWMDQKSVRGLGAVWEWLAVRGLGVACLVTLVSVLFAWPEFTRGASDELAELADPLIVADLSQ